MNNFFVRANDQDRTGELILTPARVRDALLGEFPTLSNSSFEPMTRIELVTSSLPWMCSTD